MINWAMRCFDFLNKLAEALKDLQGQSTTEGLRNIRFTPRPDAFKTTET